MTQPDAPFDAPWQAQLFALTVAMNEAGHFTWAAWAKTFGPRVKEAAPNHYWTVWADALVALLEQEGIAAADEVKDLARLWQEAARATPHGREIMLS
ncbi:MAG: nitrile hydratase accessory protein [Pseudomonadota bacterium]